MTVDRAMAIFGPGDQRVTLYGQEFDLSLLRELQTGLGELIGLTLKLQGESIEHRQALTNAISELRDQVRSQRLHEEDLEAIAEAISSLPPSSRSVVMDYLTGLGSAAWATVIIEAIQRIHV